MLAALVIVFREVLEAGLIISVILAACRGTPVRKYIMVGILAGAGGAIILALLTDRLESMLGGRGLELFSAGVLLLAVLMLSWQVLWMSANGKRYASTRYRETERLLAEKGGYSSIAICVLFRIYGPFAEGTLLSLVAAQLMTGVLLICHQHILRVTDP
ncbi:FTR1 family protein [Rahnella laticis]|uniref:FTR1 family protein n=1 Tax=Rahnella laticis TaxID=2787622 RepID=UPI0018A2C41E|nr:FTR1 family protein [Rahnella laticis]MBF7997525.1 FTR1 family protein [Rahnella laticis]